MFTTNSFMRHCGNRNPRSSNIRVNYSSPFSKGLVFATPLSGWSPTGFQAEGSAWRGKTEAVGGTAQAPSHLGNGAFGMKFAFNEYYKFSNNAGIDLTGTEVTMVVQCYPTDVTQVIFGKQHAATHVTPFFKYSLYHDNLNGLNVRVDSTSFGTGTNTMLQNQWHFVAGRYNGANLDAFITGSGRELNKYSGTAKTSNIVSSIYPLVIGANADAGEGYEGVIADVRVYNRALTDSEIAQLANPQNFYDIYLDPFDVTTRVPAPAVPSTGAVFNQAIIIT